MKWQSKRPAHYQYRSGYSCFCLSATYLVEAKGEVVTEAKLVFFGSPPPTPSLQSHSIDSAFARLRDLQASNPGRLDVTYDPESGFPSHIFVDRRLDAIDDERHIHIDHFRVFPPGMTLANDTVFTADSPDLPEERRILRIANDGVSTLYLNSVKLSVAPGDTFANLGVAVRFAVATPVSSSQPLRPVLRYGNFGTDTVEAVAGVSIPPGKELILADFRYDACFCLLKASRQIKEGDPLTLMLRLDFSRGAPAERGDIRAYAYVSGKYGMTSSIAGAPAKRKAGAGTFTGWRRGLWLEGERAFAPDGRRVSVSP